MEGGLSQRTDACRPRTGTLSELRLSRGYQLAVRAFGSAWFLLLAILVLKGIAKSFPLHSLPQLGLHGWADLVSRSLVI